MKHNISTQFARFFILLTGACLIPVSYTFAAQVFATDLIVQGSTCIGFDCASTESFGFDTLRLKENNLRIKAEDTSVSAEFPSNDWQLTFNDTSDGGANKFSIDDVTGGNTPFTIIAGAPSHSLFVSSAGRLGLGTSSPVVDAHIKTGNTPTVRLEQDGSSGFAAQTWDVASNEANFFIRDTTNGSTLPFRIKPGAPSNSIYIRESGNVGIGSSLPNASLKVERNNGTAKLLIEEKSAVTNKRTLAELKNNGSPVMLFSNTSTGQQWQMNPDGQDNFIINNIGSGGAELLIRKATGDTIVRGTVTSQGVLLTSSRETKEEFKPVNNAEILDKVSQLNISEWKFKADKAGAPRHIGPMAEDFEQAFQLGSSGKTIGVTDVNGITLASIQALNQKLSDKDAQIDELNQRLKRLEIILQTKN